MGDIHYPNKYINTHTKDIREKVITAQNNAALKCQHIKKQHVCAPRGSYDKVLCQVASQFNLPLNHLSKRAVTGRVQPGRKALFRKRGPVPPLNSIEGKVAAILLEMWQPLSISGGLSLVQRPP